MVSEEPTIVVLKTETVSDTQGHMWIREDLEDLGRFYRYMVISIPSEGCFHFLDAYALAEDWPTFLPIYRAMVSHWADLSRQPLGFELSEEQPEFSE